MEEFVFKYILLRKGGLVDWFKCGVIIYFDNEGGMEG